MLIKQPSLADHFASLRAATAPTPACAWLPETLHALIMAALTRLFAHLEHLRQSGHAERWDDDGVYTYRAS